MRIGREGQKKGGRNKKGLSALRSKVRGAIGAPQPVAELPHLPQRRRMVIREGHPAHAPVEPAWYGGVTFGIESVSFGLNQSCLVSLGSTGPSLEYA